jgi:hypothetical protein
VYSFPSGTPVAGDIVVDPCVEFKAIEADALAADRQLGEIRPDFCIEPVPIHPEIGRRVSEPDDAWQEQLPHRPPSDSRLGIQHGHHWCTAELPLDGDQSGFLEAS